jgi:hypothetical protein
MPARRYFAFTDFTLGISHLDDGVAVLDLTRECKPPFSHQNVVREFAATCRSYRCFEVSGDNYSREIVAGMYRDQGVAYRKSARTKSEIFLDLLPMMNSGRVELLDDTRLFQQLCGLERTVARAGRETVCKSAGNHDDVANSCAGSLCLAALAAPALKYAPPIIITGAPYGSGSGLPPVINETPSGNPSVRYGEEYQTGGDSGWLRCMGWAARHVRNG